MIAVAMVLLIGLLTWAMGRRILRLFGFEFSDALEEFCFAVPLAAGLLTLAVFAMGVLHLYRPGWIAALLAVWTAGCFTDIKRVVLTVVLNRFFLPRLQSLSRWEKIMVLLLGFLYLLTFVASLAPPTNFDNTVYHLTVPKVFTDHHGLESRDDVWVHKTGGFYMIYLIGMIFGYDTVAKLSVFWAAVVATLALYVLGRRFHSHRAGLLAAFLFGTSPMIGVMTGEYLEAAILFYAIAAIHAFLLYVFAREERMLFLIPVFVGLAVSTKITAVPLLVLAVPTLAVMAYRSGGAWGRWLVRSGGLLLLGLAFSSFWFFWNYATTGRFFFPYGGSILSPDGGGGLPPLPSFSGIAGHIGTFAQYIFVMGEYWNESAGPAVLVALVLILLFHRKGIAACLTVLCLSMVAFYAVTVVITHGVQALGSPMIPHARYGMPVVLATLPLAGGIVLAWLSGRSRFLKGTIIIAMLLPLLHVGGIKMLKVAVQVPVVLGLESRETYLKKKVETYEACHYVNQQLPRDSKVLAMLFRPYFLDRRYIHAPANRGTAFFAGLKTKEDLLRKMSDGGITHVVYETMLSTWWDYAPVFIRRPDEPPGETHRHMDGEFFDPENFTVLYEKKFDRGEKSVMVRVYRFHPVQRR